MKVVYMLFLLLLIGTAGKAQQKLKFVSQQVVGLLEGESGSAFQLQSINGLQWKKWLMGLGAGIDWYEYRSVPVFLSMNYDLKLSNRSFFVSADAGTNLPWVKNNSSDFGGSQKSDFKKGLYTNAGIGYKLRLKNTKDGFLVHLGFSSKRLKEIKTYPNFCPGGPCGISTETYDYRMRRISVRLGWLF